VRRSREICRTLSLDTAVYDEGVRFSVRWILFQMLAETSRHLGHIDAVAGAAGRRSRVLIRILIRPAPAGPVTAA